MKTVPETIQFVFPLSIENYARGVFLVESRSRIDIKHLVDVEGFDGEDVYCSCEAFTIGKARPCIHIERIIEKAYE
jgi:hypothetical protein